MKHTNNNQVFSKSPKGATLIVVVVFLAIFSMLAAGFLGLITYQRKLSLSRVIKEQAINVAEAGINYYRWRFSHKTDDYLTVTTISRDYADFSGQLIGKYDLEIVQPDECSSVIQITSQGETAFNPKIKRKIALRYGKPSLAEYAFITNSNVWFGGELDGKIHANGGIRMDAEQNSISTSAKDQYICGPEHGCQYEQKPGIWGGGEGEEDGLWVFPAPAIDFDTITLDLAAMKQTAIEQGLYLPPSEAFGYYLKFKNDNNVDIYKVTKLKNPVWGYNGTEWVKESLDIDGIPTILTSYLISGTSCDKRNLIFVEDNVWVDGEIMAKTTVAAARFPDLPETNASIIIPGSTTYAEPKKARLALVAQKNVLIPLYAPDHLEIDAVMIAQKGRAFRYYYPSDYSPWHLRDKLEIRGSIITNGIAAFTWVDSKGGVTSGYRENENSFDSNLVYYPPPYLPTLGDYKVISWEEK